MSNSFKEFLSKAQETLRESAERQLCRALMKGSLMQILPKEDFLIHFLGMLVPLFGDRLYSSIKEEDPSFDLLSASEEDLLPMLVRVIETFDRENPEIAEKINASKIH